MGRTARYGATETRDRRDAREDARRERVAGTVRPGFDVYEEETCRGELWYAKAYIDAIDAWSFAVNSAADRARLSGMPLRWFEREADRLMTQALKLLKRAEYCGFTHHWLHTTEARRLTNKL